MAEEIQRFTDETISQYNLLSDEEVATLKIKVGKSHRSEKDWDVIKKLITDNIFSFISGLITSLI